jgi:hypothetical protein
MEFVKHNQQPNMKKIIKLTESDLTRIIERVINESELMISPFKIQAVNGLLKITDTTKSKSIKYRLEKTLVGFRKSLYVESLDENKMVVSVAGIKQDVMIFKEKLKMFLSKNFGKDEVTYKTEDGSTVYFVKVG